MDRPRIGATHAFRTSPQLFGGIIWGFSHHFYLSLLTPLFRVQAPPGGYPVLYITDGQNVFEDATSHQGVSWRAAECAAHLSAFAFGASA